MYEQREEATETEGEKLNHSFAPPGEARRLPMLGCLMWDLFLRGKIKKRGRGAACGRRVKRDKWLDVEAVNESILMRGAVCGCP